MISTRSLVSILAALALAGCAAGEEAAVPAPVVPATAGAGQFGLTERAFVELEIATDDQAVKLLDLGVEHVAAPGLRDLARDIGTARRAELAELHGLLDTAAVQYVNNHEGHDMPGMPTNEELSALQASGVGFDTMFAQLLKAHLDESAGVVRSASQAVVHEATRTIVTRMATDRRQFLQRLSQLVQV
jgi:uncharacterized protein (DUF305 family)